MRFRVQPRPVVTGKSAKPQADFGRLARRISAWTTNCLLTAIVLLASVGFGRQVLQWWGVGASGSSPGTPSSDQNDPLGDPRYFHVLEFGNQPWTVGQQLVAGDKRQAMAKLRGLSGRLLRRSEIPPDTPPLEKALRADLSRRKPADEEPGKWKLYELDGPFPLLLGTAAGGWGKATGTVAQQGSASGAPATPRPALAESDARVVIWGLAIPATPHAWTLYTFQPHGGISTPAAPEIPIPPGGRRILSAGVAGAAKVTAFAGQAAAEDWKRFYQAWFSEHGWTVQAAWQSSGTRRHAKYAGRIGGQPSEAEIEFGDDERQGQAGLSGMLVIVPVK